ncbi:MAG: archaetidylinositol phosphate synthase [Acidilobus sp.]
MVIGKLRNFINRLAPSTVGRALAEMGVKPDHITYLGLGLAILAPVMAAIDIPWSVPVLIAVSSLMDVLDGAVARALRRTTPFGSYLDSLTDRVSDAMFILALIILGANVYVSIIALTFSFLVSYSRSKGELLGVKMEGVGIAERGERSVLLLIGSLFAAMRNLLIVNALMLFLWILALITVVQRSIHVKRGLSP